MKSTSLLTASNPRRRRMSSSMLALHFLWGKTMRNIWFGVQGAPAVFSK